MLYYNYILWSVEIKIHGSIQRRGGTGGGLPGGEGGLPGEPLQGGVGVCDVEGRGGAGGSAGPLMS